MLTIICKTAFVSYETIHSPDKLQDDPTTRVFTAMVDAYAHFDKALFGATLPKCVITWQRKSKSHGYFASHRFKARNSDTVVDEIALNPAYFSERTTKEILSTLVHEQAHVWQQHHGKPSRTGYHNVEWSEKMERLGLIPSSTGRPGGKRTGQRVSHYIAIGGPFDRACDDLLSQGYNIEFADRVTPTESPKRAGASRKKLAYSCKGCRANTWGKPGLNIFCGDCQIAFVAA